ncbi:SUMF1/EgtB/PvdO family nonheme iron enzyme [Streptomyces sp. NBC_00647]|uniref:caspase, EACC1-associated type n=1 Tax=Streptomyces sp. NBC_00647 TaxID=2975796 RepID=UPI00324687D5
MAEKNTGGRFALVIAADNFKDPGLRQLRGPQADVQALAEVLSSPEVGGFEVRTIVNEPSHKVRRAVEEFYSARRRDDLLLFYFSGHGLKDFRGQLYFAMPDTERRFLQSTAVSAQFIGEMMNECVTRTQVVLLDCCHSGAFTRGMAAKADSAMHTAERLGGQGRVVLTASDAMQYAFEGDDLTGQGVGSVFTRVLVQGLKTGDADINQDGEVDIDELYSYIYDHVVSENRSQQPQKWALDVKGKVIVARYSIAPPSLPVELQVALESPFVGIRFGAVEELGSLLNSEHLDITEAARNALKACADDDSKRVSGAALSLLEGTYELSAQTASPSASSDSNGHPLDFSPKIIERHIKGPQLIKIPGRDFPDFEISRYPVTNQDFYYYVVASGRRPPKHWGGDHPSEKIADHPVVWVTWAAARGYCTWLSSELGVPYRLPAAAEWKKAAQGEDHRIFPWGNEWDPKRCHHKSRSTAPVTRFSPAGDSPYGVSDMSGNAREWVSDIRVYARSEYIVVCGGGFLDREPEDFHCSKTATVVGDAKASIGFRLAIGAKP